MYSRRISAAVIFCLLFMQAPNAALAQKMAVERYKVIPNGLSSGDIFGAVVDIDAGTIVGGAPLDDELDFDAGAFYKIDAESGAVEAKVVTQIDPFPATLFRNLFASALAIDGDVIAVGARGRDLLGTLAGEVNVFSNSSLNQTVVLSPFSELGDSVVGAGFGWSVALNQGFLVVGSPGDLDGANFGGGAAYIFTAGPNPQLIDKITASDASGFANYGRVVAVNSAVAAIAAPFERSVAIDGGAVYLHDAATAQELLKIVPDDIQQGDIFGISLAISESVLAVGAPFQDGGQANSGAVYLYELPTGELLHKLEAPVAVEDMRFGEAIAIKGNTVVIGAPVDNSERGARTGAVYVFDISQGEMRDKFVGSDSNFEDFFGGALAIEDTTVVVGAEANDESGNAAGAIYVFDLVGDEPSDLDLDGVLDSIDNCTLANNTSQFDSDGDGFGNACDPDLNNDCIVNFLDLTAFSSVFLSADDDADFNEDGVVNFLDFVTLSEFFLLEPGPSALADCSSNGI